MRSPGTNCYNRPLFNVKTLSDVEPGNKLLAKVTTPFGEIPK